MMQFLAWSSARVAIGDERGQTAVEYALVVALVAVVIAGVLALGATNFFTSFWDTVKSAIS